MNIIEFEEKIERIGYRFIHTDRAVDYTYYRKGADYYAYHGPSDSVAKYRANTIGTFDPRNDRELMQFTKLNIVKLEHRNMNKKLESKLRRVIRKEIKSLILSENSSKIKNAIEDIVTYETLPSQIDARQPWKGKADAARKYLLSQTNGKFYIQSAEKQIQQYHSDPNSRLNDLF